MKPLGGLSQDCWALGLGTCPRPWNSKSPWGIEEGWGAETSLPGIPPAFPGPCPPSSLPQPSNKLFQACKIWAVTLLLTAPSEAKAWARIRKPAASTEPRWFWSSWMEETG